jgi:hypothetical protein
MWSELTLVNHDQQALTALTLHEDMAEVMKGTLGSCVFGIVAWDTLSLSAMYLGKVYG